MCLDSLIAGSLRGSLLRTLLFAVASSAFERRPPRIPPALVLSNNLHRRKSLRIDRSYLIILVALVSISFQAHRFSKRMGDVTNRYALLFGVYVHGPVPFAAFQPMRRGHKQPKHTSLCNFKNFKLINQSGYIV